MFGELAGRMELNEEEEGREDVDGERFRDERATEERRLVRGEGASSSSLCRLHRITSHYIANESKFSPVERVSGWESG